MVCKIQKQTLLPVVSLPQYLLVQKRQELDTVIKMAAVYEPLILQSIYKSRRGLQSKIVVIYYSNTYGIHEYQIHDIHSRQAIVVDLQQTE
jgi:hypothetical protein